MFRIGEFSKLAKTTVKTLRYYDEQGIFKPSAVESNGYRCYSVDDLARFAMIARLRELGISVENIKRVLDGEDLVAALSQRSNDIKDEIAERQTALLRIEKIIERMKKGEDMDKYRAIEKQIPPCVAYYRHGTIDDMSQLFDFVLQAGAEAAEHNPSLKCTGYCFVTYEAQEYQERNVQLEYVEAVEKAGNDSLNVKFRQIEGITAVCVNHFGPYKDLQQAYAFALEYVSDHAYVVSGKIREVYIHGCWDRDDEREYLTEIQVPIKNCAK